MTSSSEDRLQQLEELSAHQTAEIETLSDAVREQWQQIDMLKKALLRQRDRLTELEESAGSGGGGGEGGGGGHVNTKPPHY
ncbi:MAG: SlyX family protein [Rhizobiaceae bacterium]